MSGHEDKKKTLGNRVVQLISLVVLFGLLFVATRVVPESEARVSGIAAVGFLVLAGTLASEMVEVIGLPHLSGYILAGVLAGPHILHLIDHKVVDDLSIVNSLALSLIAFAGGAELRFQTLRENARSLSWAIFLQCIFGLLLMTGVFMAVSPLVPFAKALPLLPLFGVGMLWGTLSITRSPSACLGILSQTRAKGPVATFALSFIMSSDVAVLIVVAVVITLVKPMLDPNATISVQSFIDVWNEILGSIAIGTTLGLALAIYMRLVGRELILVLVALGFGMTAVLKYLHLDALLVFLTAGFVVQNLSKQGPSFLHAIERTGGVVYVLFFALAGAHLDVPLLKKLWPAAVSLAVARALITWGLSRISSRLARDKPTVATWGWSGLVSQAGLALGLALTISKAFPSVGDGFRSLAIATVALNEMIGPVLFKLSLDRAGETSQQAVTRDSLVAETPPPTA